MKKRQKALWAVLVGIIAVATPTWAQSPTTNVEVEPVTCWWRTSQSSVRIAEHFSLTLTCSVLEAEAARAVIDRTRLAPAAVQLPPYEVLGGTQGDDLTSTGRRFFQYVYNLRLMTEGTFGVDVPIPGLELTYRIESRVEQDRALQGREQTYLLPSLSMHVTSLVPSDATHIREAPAPTLAAVAARENRGTLMRSVGAILASIGGLLLLVAIIRRATKRRSPADIAAARLLSHRAVIRAAQGELAAVASESRGGWTTELATRALAATRVIASYAADKPVTQRVASTSTPTEGELRVPVGGLSRRVILVSGAATTRTVDGLDADLGDALTKLTVARYGRNEELNSSDLGEALEAAQRAAQRVATHHGVVASGLRTLRRETIERAWAR